MKPGMVKYLLSGGSNVRVCVEERRYEINGSAAERAVDLTR